MLRRAAAVVAAACMSVTGLAGTANASPSPGSQGLSWGECTDMDTGGTNIQCADLSVPADWHRPQGKRTSIGLAKLPAQNPEQRIGTLLVNLGGNGTSAKHLPGSKKELAELTQWFDVIAFDARGKGTSSAVTCPPKPSTATPLLSTGRKAWRQFAQANREWEATCRQKAGALAGHLNSWQVAHDMEAIRTALGEGKLTYYGNSYGTVYGKAYAELFPTKVRRMFLDSAPNHTERSLLQRTAPMAKIIADKFQQFGQWCETNTDCALHPNNARAVWDELMAKARQHPLPAPGAGDGKTVGPAKLRFTTLNFVADRSLWPKFAQALAKARAGDASDFYVTPSAVPPDKSAQRLAYCSDFPFEKGWGAMTRVERRLRDIAPRVGWLTARAKYSRCAGLQQQGSFPPHRIDPEGLPPVLLVNGTRDHNTPPAGGRALAKQLPGSVWIGADTGHAVYLDGNRCVRDIAHRYLRTGALPKPGRTCPANKPKGARQPHTTGH